MRLSPPWWTVVAYSIHSFARHTMEWGSVLLIAVGASFNFTGVPVRPVESIVDRPVRVMSGSAVHVKEMSERCTD